MNDFDPGPGWRPIAEKDIRLSDTVISYASEYGTDPTWWVREPQLPTEPYTVIRTGPMRWMKCGLYVHPDGSKGNPDAWVLLPFESQTERRTIHAANLAVTCTYDVKSVREQAAEFGFKVLAEPTPRVALYQEQQRVAKDILALIRGTANEVVESDELTITGERFRAIAREYRVAP